MKSSLRNMVVVLFAITFISSSAVGYVFQLTKEPIARADAEKLSSDIKQVMPPFDTLSEEIKLPVEGADTMSLYIASMGGEPVGYALSSGAFGYGGNVKLLVGFTSEGNINKVAVSSHAETPGLGAKITDGSSHFVTQFEGKNPDTFNMSVTKDGGEVDAITASTITSRAYTKAISNAHTQLMNYIKNNK